MASVVEVVVAPDVEVVVGALVVVVGFAVLEVVVELLVLLEHAAKPTAASASAPPRRMGRARVLLAECDELMVRGPFVPCEMHTIFAELAPPARVFGASRSAGDGINQARENIREMGRRPGALDPSEVRARGHHLIGDPVSVVPPPWNAPALASTP